MPDSNPGKNRGPKTALDEKFLVIARQVMRSRGITSDRAISLELGRNQDFINRVQNGFQSATPEAWDDLLNKYPEAASINQNYNTGIAIGTNHGTATQNYTTLADCEKELLACKAQLTEATTKLIKAEQERDAFSRELDVMRELVKAKDETISLLRGGYNRPN
jgi:hypothetical protein